MRIASLVSLLVTLSWACDAPAPADSAPDAIAPAQLPTRCEIEMTRYARGPKHYSTIPRYCLDGGTFQPCKP